MRSKLWLALIPTENSSRTQQVIIMWVNFNRDISQIYGERDEVWFVITHRLLGLELTWMSVVSNPWALIWFFLPLCRETLEAGVTNIHMLLLASDSFSSGSQERYEWPALLITYISTEFIGLQLTCSSTELHSYKWFCERCHRLIENIW